MNLQERLIKKIDKYGGRDKFHEDIFNLSYTVPETHDQIVNGFSIFYTNIKYGKNAEWSINRYQDIYALLLT